MRWHFYSSGCIFRLHATPAPASGSSSAAPPWLLSAFMRCCPVITRLHLSQLTAAVDTSLSPYWGSISSLIQPRWESLQQDAGVMRPRSHFSLQRRRRDHVQKLSCNAKLDVTESGILQGNSFTFPDLSCNSKKNSNNLNNKTILLVLSRAAEARIGNIFCTLRHGLNVIIVQSVDPLWCWRKQEQFEQTSFLGGA